MFKHSPFKFSHWSNIHSLTTTTTTYARHYATLKERAYIHQVKVNNLPRHSLAKIFQFFKAKNLSRFYKARNATCAYINCDTEKAAKYALEKLEGAKFNENWVLSTEYCKLTQDEFRAQQRKVTSKSTKEESRPNSKRSAVHEVDPKIRIAQHITPYYQRSYESQLNRKSKSGQRYLTKLIKSIRAYKAGLDERGRAQIAWVDEDCPYLGAIPSPLLTGYSSQCSFNIGRDLQDKISVGFVLGPDRHGSFGVIQPDQCINISNKAKQIAKAMETYVKESKYDVYDPIEKTGFWQSMMIRTQRTGEIMICIRLNSDQLKNDKVENEKERLLSYWKKLKQDNEIPVTTLLVQTVQDEKTATEALYGNFTVQSTDTLIGEGYVYEEIQGQRFRISADAMDSFINTPYATESIIQNVKEWCKKTEKPVTLLNVGCGVGVLSNTLANVVDEMIGIDTSVDNIEDAKANAILNNIPNAHYSVDTISNALRSLDPKYNDMIAILNASANDELSNADLAALRSKEQLQKIIVFSSEPRTHMSSFITLCRPMSSKLAGRPFRPSRAMVLDAFPHKPQLLFMLELTRTD